MMLKTEQTLFSIVEMHQFSGRLLFPISFLPSAFPIKRVFAIFFSLDSCRAGMNLNQAFISAPGTVMSYNSVYMHNMFLFAHILENTFFNV